jgi:hypothetical protein
VTISPTNKVTTVKKRIWKYMKGLAFYRSGSNSMSTFGKYELKSTNKNVVEAIEKNAMNNIELTLDGVFDFFKRHDNSYHPMYKVFNEQFVLCWAGRKKSVGDKIFYSRVDIELVNEQVRLFYSALDEVKIEHNDHSFIMTEYVYLRVKDIYDYYPFEKTVIHFKENGKHHIVKEFLFKPPLFDKAELHHVFNSCNAILDKFQKGLSLNERELADLPELPTNYLICVLNEIPNAHAKFLAIRPFLREMDDKTAYIKFKEAARILRKVSYQ